MIRYRIEDARPIHVGMIARRTRPEDRAEIAAMVGSCDLRRILRYTFRSSLYRRVCFVEDEIAAMWGIDGGLLAATGHPWLVTTPAIERIPLAFFRECRREAALYLDRRCSLVSHVAASYTRAVRFMLMLGFEIRETVMINDEPFYEIVMEPR
jgi:hypothetical protein